MIFLQTYLDLKLITLPVTLMTYRQDTHCRHYFDGFGPAPFSDRYSIFCLTLAGVLNFRFLSFCDPTIMIMHQSIETQIFIK